MKTKRRHDLQTNELADRLGHYIENVKPYTQYILGGVIAVVAIIGFVAYQVASQKDRKASAWRDYYKEMASRSEDGLEAVATRHSNSPAAAFALLAAGDSDLAEGAQQLFTNREGAIDRLREAQKNYEAVIQKAPTNKLLRERAELGLAQTYESLNELELAKEHYAKLVNKSTDSIFGQLASRSMRRLDDPATQDVYKQLYGLIIDPAAEYPDLPERPDFSFPGDDGALASWESVTDEESATDETSPDETSTDKTSDASTETLNDKDASDDKSKSSATADEKTSDKDAGDEKTSESDPSKE